jgi:hypothetical protein
MLMLPTLVADAQDATITPATQIIILAPAPGQALQGTILINGEINVGQPLTIELSFSYSDNARETWFIIQEIEQANPGEFNLEWDTTTLTDGQYTLRLVVTTEQDQFIAYAPSLRVRNYSAIETSSRPDKYWGYQQEYRQRSISRSEPLCHLGYISICSK